MRFRPLACLALAALAVSLHADEPLTPGTREAFARARTERVAVVGIGDSNQRFGGHGWSASMAQALASQFGCWGTGVRWMASTKEDLAQHGPTPAQFATSFSGWYLPAGQTDRVSWKHGQMSIPADDPMDVSGNLRFSLRYGTFTTGEGQFQPSIRVDQPPWSILTAQPPIPTLAAAQTLTNATLDLPADPARHTQLMCSAAPVSRDIHGPVYLACLQGENRDKLTVIAYSTLYAAGGQSLYDMLTTFTQVWGQARCADYFRQIRLPLNGDKRCIVMISSGLNDRNEAALSIGPQGKLPSASPEGYRDNLAGIVAALQTAWIQAGGTPDTIFFAFMPSHPVSDPDDAKLVAYRAQAVALAQALPNAGCILWPQLVTYQQMATGKYYDKDAPSSPHLSREGYQALSQAAAQALAQ